MYARRIQLTNYGPIDHVDIHFPFRDDGRPKPVVLVGENGSGKSVLLSHIVNALIAAKGVAYPESTEASADNVYKLRSSTYIKAGHDYYFARVDFMNDFSVTELRLARPKNSYPLPPNEVLHSDAQDLWDKLGDEDHDYYAPSVQSHPLLPVSAEAQNVKHAFAGHCVLYFPSNRFEDPAWLNLENLAAQAEHIERSDVIEGQTSRRVIASTVLRDNQNWLFDVAFDSALFETTPHLPTVSKQGESVANLISRLEMRGDGPASRAYTRAVDLIRLITQDPRVRFGIGRRRNRSISLISGESYLAPNLFQLSSGETSLLNLFLSILRDYDWTGPAVEELSDVPGLVVVDEIDLHLHVKHQHDVLPTLLKAFSGVQFIVTTHSPLFVLGMRNVFGEDGFALYRLPDGQKISAEEFSEFGDAYRAFADTRKHADELRKAIEEANGPVVCFEGPTDVRYVKRAAELLSRTASLGDVDFLNIGGEGNLRNAWKGIVSSLAGHLGGKIVLVADCDSTQTDADRGPLAWRRIPRVLDNPVRDGIENLFTKEALEEAYAYDRQLFDTTAQVKKEKPDRTESFEQWVIRKERKADLCDWLCANGTAEHFRHFSTVLDLIEAALSDTGKVG